MTFEPMKFAGNRPLAEIKKAVKKKKWLWDQRAHDLRGSDFVTFQFAPKTYQPNIVVYNTFNGKFLVKDEFRNKIYTEESVDAEQQFQWYRDLLNFLYVPLENSAEALTKAT